MIPLMVLACRRPLPGDCAQSIDDEEEQARQAHWRGFRPSGVLRVAFQSLGKGTVQRSGIDGTCSALLFMAGVASAACKAQEDILG